MNFISTQRNTGGKAKLFINFRGNWDAQKAITFVEIQAGHKGEHPALTRSPFMFEDSKCPRPSLCVSLERRQFLWYKGGGELSRLH